MLRQVTTLLRYRLLISSLVGRELKARYRGSVLGFFWSFINPLLLLLTYWLVFTYLLPGVRGQGVEPYFLFLFCGILPWTWFSASTAICRLRVVALSSCMPGSAAPSDPSRSPARWGAPSLLSCCWSTTLARRRRTSR